MSMSLADLGLSVNFVSECSGLDLARPRAQSHRSTKLLDAAQFPQLVDHAMGSRWIEFTGVGIGQSADVAGKFDASRLHPQADSKVWHVLFAGVLNRFQHAFDATLSKSTWHQ